MSSIESIKKYWDERATLHGDNPTATTNDVYLREIEVASIMGALKAAQSEGVSSVADIGCGNGYSTLQYAKVFPELTFHGYDYSEAMVENAKRSGEEARVENISFDKYDVLSGPTGEKFDLITTDRCLINLSSWELQQQGLDHIYDSLVDGGSFVMIENFVEGQKEFNALRRQFDLPEIPIRGHNHFFEREPFEKYMSHKFEIVERTNISSAYYVVSRIIYSSICQKNGDSPDYLDIHHDLGSKLPFFGEFGPIVFYKFRRI